MSLVSPSAVSGGAGRGAEVRRAGLRWGPHVLAAAVVVAGIAATVMRPFAPSMDAGADPLRWFDAAYLAQASAYRTPRYVAVAVGLVARIGLPLLVAFTPWGRRVVARILALARHRPLLGPVAVVLTVVVAVDVLLLPLNLWIGYVHAGRFGFRTQGLAGWTADWLIGNGQAWLLVAGVTAGGWWLLRRLPRMWPAVAGLVGAATVVVLVTAGPLVLEPLRFRTVPLEPGPTRVAVEAVVARSGQPLDDIVVADASRRTLHQNAYVSGLGATRRMVLYDTLVTAQPPEIVAQVVAHELAHDLHGDLMRGTLLGAAGVVAAAYALYGFASWRVRTRRQSSLDDPHSAGAMVAAVVVLLVLVAPVQHWVSRQAESAADLGSLELTQDPATYTEQRLAVTTANLGDPSPPRWYRILRSTHPSAVERLQMGAAWPLEWRGPFAP